MDSYIKPITIFEDKNNNIFNDYLCQSMLTFKDISNDHSILNAFSDLIIVKDRFSRFVNCNIAMSKASGIDISKIKGMSDNLMIWSEGDAFKYFIEKDRRVHSGYEQVNIGSYRYIEGYRLVIVRRIPLFEKGFIVGSIAILTEVKNRSSKHIIDMVDSFGIKIKNTQLIDHLNFLFKNQNGKIKFTEKQKNILIQLIQHGTSETIGEKLFKSPRTIENYLYRLRKELNLSSNRELVEWLWDEGYVREWMLNN